MLYQKVSVFLFIFLWLISLSNTSLAQLPETLNFNHLTQQDGLSQSSGQAIYQDSQGYMWFGTSNGLNKYNGYDMTVYMHDPIDSTTISGNTISTIYEDSQNNLWVGTTGSGLNLFNRDRNSFSHYKQDYSNPDKGLSDNSITSILETSTGEFWIATYNGLNLLDRDTGEFIQFHANTDDSTGLGGNQINYLYEDKDGYFWVGTNNGLNLWNPDTGTFKHFKGEEAHPDDNSVNNVMVIYEDGKSNLWIGTTNGLHRYNKEKDKLYSYKYDANDPEGISGNSILAILEDSRGVVWIGTENNGLNAFNHEKETFQWYKQNLDDPASLSNNSIYSIFENDDHILWIGTYSGAINYIDRKEQKFEHYTYDKNSPHPLSAKSVTSFLEDSQGNFWVGTDGGGLNRFDRNTGYFYPIRHEPGNPNSLSSDVVLALLEASDGYIWIGYYHGGISRFNPENETFTHYRHDPNNSSGLCHDDVFSLYEDEQNTLWVGTNGAGVCRLNDDGTFTKFQAEEGVIRDILIDSNGDFWVGTYGGGLKLLGLNDDEELWNFYEGDNGLRSNIILTLHVDAQNNFWIGTKEGGLTLFDRDSLRLTTRNKRFKSYNMSDGLPGNEIKGILEDDHGNLWMSTNNGISKFVPGEESFFNYNLEDGLQGTEFNTLAYYKDRQGYMYFGGINGFNRFHPDSIKSNPFEYPVVFTDIKLFNNTIQAGEGQPLDKHASQATKMVVPHTATVLTFEYAALNFNALKGIRYAYILEGFEENWNEVGNKRSITYTNLSPGDYTLRVRTVNSDGIWNEDEATLALTVTPPFWQKTWFYLVSFLLAGGFIFGVYRYRVRRITTQNRILINKVAERTSELKEKNKELERVLEDLSETRNELVQKAHKAGMADIAAGVVHNIGNVLNSIGASTSITSEVLKKSKFEGLFKANKMLIDRADNLQQFIVDDPKGKKLIEYYKKLDESIREELETLKQHNQRMEKKVQLINNVITAQQSYASVGLNNEIAKLDVILDDALIIYASSFDKHNISIEKNIQPVAAVSVQKTKLVHVILNILKNAKEAIVGSGMKEGVITINLYNDGSFVVLEISDNGPGIHHNHLDKIYNHGFTTKKDGHGFGLHSSANYMSEMGGKIKAYNSAGDKGAVFVLSFPVNSNGS